MEIIIQPTHQAATEVAARLIARQLREKPDAVLGLATGSTPLLLYRTFVSINHASILQMHPQVKVCLDEPSASKLKRADYFRWVYENKPQWQTI